MRCIQHLYYVAVRVHDVDGLGGGSAGHLVLCAGAVVRKAEEGALAPRQRSIP